jgi:NSS family neurotransmitter:Na+ symporter
MEEKAIHETWSSTRVFILAAVGSAVGLGNIWRFPYLAGENGGGAFVVVYILAVAMVAMPMLAAELLIGRRGRRSPINTMRILAAQEGASPAWRFHGWLMVSVAVIGPSFFSVISGWCLAYIPIAASGAFAGVDGARSAAILQELMDSPLRMIVWHGVFMALTVVIVAGGVNRGLARAVRLLMPTLFVLLVCLVGYATVIGDLGGALRFLFTPDFSKIDANVVLIALGQSFLSVSIGVGVMMTYGAYLPASARIPRGVVTIACVDTLVALTAGLAIFPIVFAYGLAPDEGPGLIFATLPIAFGQMPAGTLVGTLFFVLLILAALTSSIGLLEVVVSWLTEETKISRRTLAIGAGTLTWAIGIASALSFNVWSELTPLSMFPLFEHETFFGLVEYLTANIMTPTSVLLIAVFGGWVMSSGSAREELGLSDGLGFRVWRFLIRYVAPLVVATIFVIHLA